MDGYVRVSRVAGREGDSFISPAVQREQIEAWAKLRSVEIAAWHEDLDQSGGKLNRPGLEALLARIESGDTAGVVIAKLDRLSRLGVADALKLVERITDGGGTIAALDLGIDPTTPFGEFGMTLMLAMARMERRRLTESWDVAKERAMDRGVKIGPTPLGYQRETNGTLSAHPQQGPIVSEAYRLAALSGLQAAMAHLQREAPEREWTTFTARRLLSTRTYLGESHYGGRMEPDAHPALTDRPTWERAQSTPERRQPSADFPLSGIPTCGTCGAPMVGGRSGGGEGKPSKRTYRCSASLSTTRREKCAKPPTILADTLEGYVRESLRPVLDGLSVSVADDDELGQAERDLLAAEDELQAFAADTTLRQALGSTYHGQLAARVQAIEGAQQRYRTLAQQTQATARLTGASVLDDPQQIGELLRGADLLNIIVSVGRGKVADRVRISAVDG
ncbi:MAG: recombinase family protein [Solirubrobacterales bacterium]|nr:recombinase family protein [Solirubrobacterales bacterium]